MKKGNLTQGVAMTLAHLSSLCELSHLATVLALEDGGSR